MSASPAEQIREEFDRARKIVRESWSEAQVLAALRSAETVALLALGEEVCPLSHADALNINLQTVWGTPCAAS